MMHVPKGPCQMGFWVFPEKSMTGNVHRRLDLCDAGRGRRRLLRQQALRGPLRVLQNAVGKNAEIQGGYDAEREGQA